MLFKLNRLWLLIITIALTIQVLTNAYAALNCPASILSQPKDNNLYLYFPTVADPSFPTWATSNLDSGSTSLLTAFNVTDLDSGIGTNAQLIDRIFEIVTDDYCEFNVGVISTTSKPDPKGPRWQIVGLGTDSATLFAGGTLFGIAQDVDTNNDNDQDYARVWASSFGNVYGSVGRALNGNNSTLERWATAIGETTAHEAAHNYGASHRDSAPRMGSSEDLQNNHIMATANTGLNGEMRAGRDRHFSDIEYAILGHNVGLSANTIHSWDLINPNNRSVDRMRIKLLSTDNSLTIGWLYSGMRSPWENPTVVNSGNTQTFQGTTYNVFNLDFDDGKSWDGPTSGVVDAGVEFHTGVGFTSKNPVIVSKVELFQEDTKLPLSPRLPGYDMGTVDLESGDFSLNFFQTDSSAEDLFLTDVNIFYLPRMLDISSMLSDSSLIDMNGQSISGILSPPAKGLRVSDHTKLPLGNLVDERIVDIIYRKEDCPSHAVSLGSSVLPRGQLGEPLAEFVVGDTDKGEVPYCLKGNALSLFPSTYIYIVATVVDLNVKHWDRETIQFVTGTVKSTLFYQVTGILPDFNENGIDDLIDIRNDTSSDRNSNGVPDEAEE